ncbi:MAG: thioredoxin [Alphaproteobacteria bacterium]|nr:thioredoxin [Alphaproteobacteria bacterium]
MTTRKVTESSFDSDVLKASGAVLVDFWAEWCGPCRAIAPSLEDMAKDMAGKVTVAKVNIDENPMIASKYQIRSIPTLMLFKDGKPVATRMGSLPKQALYQWVEQSIA